MVLVAMREFSKRDHYLVVHRRPKKTAMMSRLRLGVNRAARGESASIALLLAVILLAMPFMATATLTLERHTDIIGLANTFKEGTGLPTRNFTLSTTVRGGATGGVLWALPRYDHGASFYQNYYVETNQIDIVLDGASNVFDTSAFGVEDLIMTMRTWSVCYRDIDNTSASITLYIDAVHIDTLQISPIFPSASIFSADSIPSVVIGFWAGALSDEGVYTAPGNKIDGLVGQFEALGLWDRA